MTKTTKRYLVSSLLTFAVAFCAAILPHISDLTFEAFKSGALLGILFTGVRSGLKAIMEYFLAVNA